jgi:hypothetical protein
MPKRIPIRVAKEICKSQKCKQVIVFAHDGVLTHCVTYGKTVEDCDQAAQAGNRLKKSLGFPEVDAEPSRVKKLKQKVKELQYALALKVPNSHIVFAIPPDYRLTEKDAEEINANRDLDKKLSLDALEQVFAKIKSGDRKTLLEEVSHNICWQCFLVRKDWTLHYSDAENESYGINYTFIDYNNLKNLVFRVEGIKESKHAK